ncbi:phosphotransferase system, EIIC family protein, partial [Vibrio harveyi]
DP